MFNKNSSEAFEIINLIQNKLALQEKDMQHLSNQLSIRNYIRIAEEIKENMNSGKLLDWGCGYGQMSYLLKKRGIDVVSFDVYKHEKISESPYLSAVGIVYGRDDCPTLPFENESFDAVLSCGTIEHVPQINAALQEINRIIKKKGYYFTYMLPNKCSYTEFLSTMRGISAHPVKFLAGEIKQIYESNGFRIVKIKRANMIPKNLTGFPIVLKKICGGLDFMLTPLDRLLSAIPLLNLVCGVFEIVAIKEG